ncbi:MAG: TetR/AcrR family transcriptional regulator [Streptococcaceae bacterium]|nr:TetR/AcrR family transcriptional regulator [Streptococcaceae bacterium]
MAKRKTHDERKNEILDEAEKIFGRKGYEKATVNDILDAVGIGKGTFYYYFDSKEEVREAVIMRFVERFRVAAQEVADATNLDAHEKMKIISIGLSQKVDPDAWIFDELHKVEISSMHQRSIIEMIIVLSPIMANVVRQGIAEGIYHTPYPDETVDLILVANQFLFDINVFRDGFEEMEKTAKAFAYSLDLLLGAKSGSFDYLLENLSDVNKLFREGKENGKEVIE